MYQGDLHFAKTFIGGLYGDQAVTVKRVVKPPLFDYDVFYGSEDAFGDEPSWQGWSQHIVVKAANHREAVIAAGARSQHGNGVRYLAVGPDTDKPSYLHANKRGLVYEINHVRKTSPNRAFTVTMGALGTRHYRVDQVEVAPRRRFSSGDYDPKD